MNCPEFILNLSWIYVKILRHGLRAQVVRSNICLFMFEVFISYTSEALQN